VAWEGDQVVGQVLSIIRNGRAEVFEVSVRPAWRRRGLARALLAQALLTLRGRGIEVIRLGTVYEFRTRARDLYRSVGFRVLKEFPRYRKPAA
jgi:mycothiol synthase